MITTKKEVEEWHARWGNAQATFVSIHDKYAIYNPKDEILNHIYQSFVYNELTLFINKVKFKI